MSRREGATSHRWTAADEDALEAAMEALTPLLAHYERQRGHGRAWWDAVAGRLAPAVLVTGAACMRRWELITERRQGDLERAAEAAKRTESDSAAGGTLGVMTWEVLAQRVDDYERTVGEATLETATALAAQVTQIQRSQARLERLTTALCRAWGIGLVEGPDAVTP